MRPSRKLAIRSSLYPNRLALLFSLASSLFAAGAIGQVLPTTTSMTSNVRLGFPDWAANLPLATASANEMMGLDPDDDAPPQQRFQVKPSQFDPGKTYLVQAAWLSGIGCPTNARIAVPNESFTGVGGFSSFTDAACPVGDPNDSHVEGLLLAKTGPTANFASAVARIIGLKGQPITELGWDIRKQGNGAGSASPLGSHCGAGAPRWNIETQEGRSFFLGCNSPVAPVQMESATGWIRMRWGGGPSSPLLAFESTPGAGFPLVDIRGLHIKSLTIVFDEGQDEGGKPDQFGAAILDNIDINGVLVGRGATDAR